jgi:endonuclease/exonuclease/phosphatase (EEP) superfamily protein YafD
MFEFIAVLTGIIVLVTSISLIPHEAWWFRMLDFPRLQFSFLAAFTLVLHYLFLDLGEGLTWALIAATAISLCYQIWWILPYTFFFPRTVKRAKNPKPENRLRLLGANVLTPNRQSKKLIAIVRREDPDIFIAVEADAWWQEQLDVFEKDYPYTLKCPLDNLYGMLLYSRLPLSDTDIQYIVEDQVPSMHALVTLPSGRQIQLHSIHPAPPSPTENEESTERDAELIVVGRTAAEAGYPVIVTGDLNDVAWSDTTRLFRKVSGLLDPRMGRGMFNTFNAKYPLIRWPLDHVFHSEEFTLVSIRKLDDFGSDHFPILVDLAVQPHHGSDHETPDIDDDDHDRATEKANQKGVDKKDVHNPGTWQSRN